MKVTEKHFEIGVYGRTQAGKTRFLYELLNHWEKERRISSQSESCQDFLKHTSDQVKEFGETRPTDFNANPEPIELTVRSSKGDERVSYRLNDLLGEMLEGDIDGLESIERVGADGPITRQVQHCDAFFFFFEPESWEKPDKVEQHHEQEFRRAEMFIRYVLNSRQNVYLPIIFVITRKDCWEGNSRISALADKWGKRVVLALKTAYAHSLQGHFPHELITEQYVIAKTSAQEIDDVEGVLLNAQKMLNGILKFRREDKKAVKPILLGGLLFFVFVICIGIWIGIHDSPSTPPKPKPIFKQTESDVLKRTSAISDLLTEIQPLNALSNVDVEKLNSELKWLATTIQAKEIGLPPATEMKMRAIAVQMSELLNKFADRDPTDLELLTGVLAGVGDASLLSNDISAFQKGKYWDLQRKAVATSLADSLRTMNEIHADPVKSLGALTEILDDAIQRIKQIDIFGPDARKVLLSDLDVALQFCKKYSAERRYEATLKIDSARLEKNGTSELAKHAIWISPKTANAFSLHPRRAGGNAVLFEVQAEYFNLDLELSRSVNCIVSKFLNSSWKEVERFDLAHNDAALSVIGMPLHKTSESSIKRRLSKGGYEFVLEFSGLPKIPALIWAAASQVEARQE